MSAKMTRRSFFTKSSALAAAVSIPSVAFTAAKASEVKFDAVTDMIVVGCGGAGAAAAVTGGKLGMKVVVLEKAPDIGGNTSCNLGGCKIPYDVEQGTKMYKTECFGTASDADCKALAEQLVAFPEFMKSLGFNLEYFQRVNSYPNLLGDMKIRGTICDPTGFEALKKFGKLINEDKNITLLLNTPAKQLIKNEKGEIVGVIAEKAGKPYHIKAQRGVLLSCGGYENSGELFGNYNMPGVHENIFTAGTPYNTGDGLKMAQSAGAAEWHFPSIEWLAPCCYEASKKFGCAVPLPFFGLYGKSYILVNQRGQRFQNDARWTTHTKETLPYFNFDASGSDFGGYGSEQSKDKKNGFLNLPFFVICDQSLIEKGPLCANRADCLETRGGLYYWSVTRDLWDWSDDNQKEIELGWVAKADTIEELAKKLGLPAESLANTVKQYNGYCKDGVDMEFERPKKTLVAIDKGPFYGMKCGLAIVNTQGGPVRNGRTEVLDPYGRAIPRLYSAGELGALFGFLYEGATNYPEALMTGHFAAKEIAKQKPLS